MNYVERTPDYVASHFGVPMAKAIFELEPNDFVWRGPFDSPYGVHLVLLTDNEPGRDPELAELEDRVARTARSAMIREETEAAIADIVRAYDVRVVYEREDPPNQAQPRSRSTDEPPASSASGARRRSHASPAGAGARKPPALHRSHREGAARRSRSVGRSPRRSTCAMPRRVSMAARMRGDRLTSAPGKRQPPNIAPFDCESDPAGHGARIRYPLFNPSVSALVRIRALVRREALALGLAGPSRSHHSRSERASAAVARDYLDARRPSTSSRATTIFCS